MGFLFEKIHDLKEHGFSKIQILINSKIFIKLAVYLQNINKLKWSIVIWLNQQNLYIRKVTIICKIKHFEAKFCRNSASKSWKRSTNHARENLYQNRSYLLCIWTRNPWLHLLSKHPFRQAEGKKKSNLGKNIEHKIFKQELLEAHDPQERNTWRSAPRL